jgi:tetratricopeptide (TPR) repeat protein
MTDTESLYNQAFAAYRAGRNDQAGRLLQTLLQRHPAHPRASLLKGVVHSKSDMATGLALVELACRADPADAQAWYNLGVFEAERGRLDLALACYERAVLHDPLHVDALGNGCELMRRFDRFDEALAWADRQLALGAESWAPHLNRAVCLLQMKRFDEALEAFNQAAALDPGRPIIQWEAFSLHLFAKRFREAWRCFESRFACGHLNGVFHYPFPQPCWKGEGLAGKHILIHNEQGLGDQIMFASALPEVMAQAARTTLVVSPELEGLFRASFPQAEVLPAFNGRFAGDHPVPPWIGRLSSVDYQLPIGSLMHLRRNTPESFMGVKPWMRPSDGARGRWKEIAARLWGKSVRPRVGLCWASNPALFRLDSSRRAVKKSMPLEAMAPLMEVADVDFVSVLNWAIDPMPRPMQGRLTDLSGELRSMDDTAALIEHLDLVIAVDTSVAHLVGAMGRPVWLLLHDFADCRWTLEGETSYWYPTMRMIRQERAGDWPQVIADTKARLAASGWRTR